MRQTYVTLAISRRRQVNVQAYETDVPGLVVHRDPKKRMFWNVTHTRTGKAIAMHFTARKTAVSFVDKLRTAMPGVDWRLSAEEIRKIVDPWAMTALKTSYGGYPVGEQW